jgi:atypical dual specificity phosphatase
MPPSFRWIVPGRLAGSGLPGLLVPVEEDLEFLAEHGIRTVVSLTETAPAATGTAPFRWEHFPLADMSHPTPREAGRVCAAVVRAMEEGATLVHCRAGLGRTGMIAACVLVSLGRGAQEAVAEVRRVHASYIQTRAQEQFVGHFETWLGSTRLQGAREPAGE